MSPPEVADAVCPNCGGRGWILEPDGGQGSAQPCDCQAEARLPRLMARAGIPARYEGCTLENFEHHRPGAEGEQLHAALKRSRRYVDDFLTPEGRFEHRGLLYEGPSGVGKTHLAVGVLKALIRSYRVRGRFVDCTDLIHSLQATFESGAERGKNQILAPIIDAEVLVLDDLGAQKPSEWTQEIFYLILNKRYLRKAPTIVTTNRRLEEAADFRSERPALDAADPRRLDAEHGDMSREGRPLAWTLAAPVVSRLYEMTRQVRIEAGDFRQDTKRAW